MASKEYRDLIANHVETVKDRINMLLNGNGLNDIRNIMSRIDSTGNVPDWFTLLETEHRIPNLDGKTVGSVLEKLFVCVAEKYILNDRTINTELEPIELNINPARGVDVPELELGIKSPSRNYCTSEPYFSAYDRLLGNEYDTIVLLTNYQDAKRVNPFILQIEKIKYLRGSEVADKHSCECAKLWRDKFNSDDDFAMNQKYFRFLAYINHMDWEAERLLEIVEHVVLGNVTLEREISRIDRAFQTKNRANLRDGKDLLDTGILDRIHSLRGTNNIERSVIGLADDWVVTTQRNNARFPDENEYRRIMSGPLDGKITMSFALQWRYNFKFLFEQ